jgi:hypothetical protein
MLKHSRKEFSLATFLFIKEPENKEKIKPLKEI